jgi:hypothetical protein
MRGSAVLLLTLLVGCDNVFGLHREATYADAAVAGDALDAAKGGCWSTSTSTTTDEDADKRVDGCDPCPADPDAKIDDVDGDGVGDQCDPDPAVPDSQIVAFDGFADPPTDWTAMGGGWINTGGEYTQTVTAGLGIVERTIPATVYPAIDVRFSNPPCANLCGPGAYVQLGTRRVGCMYEYKSGTDQVSITVDGVTVQTMTPVPEASPDRIVIRVLPGNMTQCRAYSGGKLTAELTTKNSPWAMTAAHVGLFTRDASASYRSITVLGMP